MSKIKVTLKVNDFDLDDDKTIDGHVDSFGILAEGLSIVHTASVEYRDGWFETVMEVPDERQESILDLINGLTLFEADLA